ncbi:MAG TPA: hypothetical protein VHX49_05315, partial [Candidatus Acidoferrales bacterium]|nr:hypothetical protein [Candidatus Acidoferrales bacterium]
AVSATLLRRYKAQGAEPVDASLEELERLGVRYVTGDFLQEHNVVRHDEMRLARLLLEKFVNGRSWR